MIPQSKIYNEVNDKKKNRHLPLPTSYPERGNDKFVENNKGATLARHNNYSD